MSDIDHTDARALLRDALSEAQATVRSYDTKAQIVGVGYIFALGIVSQIEVLLPDRTELGLKGVVLFWGVVMVPILLFGHVLNPTRKSAPEADASRKDGIRHALYVDPARHGSVGEIREAAIAADPLNEICYELLTVSGLREIKRRRFLRALYAAALSFAFIFANQLGRIG